jgi:hypothetical protein
MRFANPGSLGGRWTWHSLRHVFCTTALFTWKLEAVDVSRMAEHANVRITPDMYVGSVRGASNRRQPWNSLIITGHASVNPFILTPVPSVIVGQSGKKTATAPIPPPQKWDKVPSVMSLKRDCGSYAANIAADDPQ